MVNIVGLAASLTRLQVQEQAADSSGALPDYKGRIGLDPILLDVERLVAALETGIFELSNMRVHQNLLLHHIGRSMARSTVLLRELCNMAGRAYRPADLLEISWRDLQWVEIQRRASPSHHEELPVRECQGHSSLDAPSELNPPQRIPSPLYVALLVPQAEG